MEGTFNHPAYGALAPCYVRSESRSQSPDVRSQSSPCAAVLAHPVVHTILNASEPTPEIPTLIAPFKRIFSTHLGLAHFAGNLLNASVIWSNHDVRRAEGHTLGGDVLVGLDNRFLVEWVPGRTRSEDGWAFKGDFWGKEGEVRELEGTGEEGAEVWFARERMG
ncbi:hypothetical protein C8R43DRAFT_442680 [Mycena crocata]|nr:hypothetical protein C8R43DRAFT_442680 [Mycena crocata]